MLRMKRLPPNSFRSEASGSPIGASAGLETSLCCCSTTSPRPLDDWDSLVTNGLACEREVILFDNAAFGFCTAARSTSLSIWT